MSYKIENITIGSDPEIFIKDNKNELSSAINLFGGTKEEPIDIGEGCFVQEDNILVEFNTPPTNNKEVFLSAINHSKDYISAILTPLDKKLYYSSSEIATDDILKEEKANVFGCAPSFNVLTQTSTELDIDSLSKKDKALRSSGFHIHIGYDNPEEETNDRLVMCFELFVTLYLINKDYDLHNRRLLYGKIGDSRDKKYGVECRSLGGYFLKDDESISKVWDQTLKAIEFAKTSDLSNGELKTYINHCLNNGEVIPESINLVLLQLGIKEEKLVNNI